MPTYEYICKSCGHLFEIVQSMRDDPLAACPQCGGELRKVFTAPAISFKGSGFYATDARKKTSRTGETQEKKAPSTSSDTGSSSGSESTTETKTDKKTDPKSAETKTGGSGKDSGSSDSGSSD